MEEAAERSYERAVQHLRGGHGVVLGKELLEHVTQTVGQYWLGCDRAAYAASRRTLVAPPAEVAAEQCVVFADGVMVHTDGDWHEARVGTVRSELGPDGPSGAGRRQASDGPRPRAKRSLVRLSDVEEFAPDLWRLAHQLGYGAAALRAFVADGSHWLWNLVERWFPDAIRIVDFWHVCEHVYQCAEAFFGEGSEAAGGWALSVCGQLRAGRVQDALVSVERLPGRGCAKRQAKHGLITYLTNNRDRMDYPRYEALGLPIGSGEVEAQCKVLVAARCKQAGMRWSRGGIESLLRVRCAVQDGRFERDFGHWPTNLTAWQARRKRDAA